MPLVNLFGNILQGENSDLYDALIVGKQPRRIRNLNLRSGGFAALPGFSTLASLDPPEYWISLFFVFDGSPNGALLATTSSGTLYKIDPETGTMTSLGTVDGTPQAVAVFKGWVIFATSANIYKIDGNTLYNFVVPPVLTAPTLSAGGSGNLTGTYQYAVSFVARKADGTGELEGQIGPVAQIIVSGQQVNISVPTSTDPQVKARKIYRRGGTVAEWYHLATIEGNDPATYVDNISDATITGHDLADVTAKTMPTDGVTSVYALHNRLWIARGLSSEPTRLYFSKLGQATVYHSLTDNVEKGGFIDIGVGDGQAIRGLASISGYLAVIKDNKIYAISGESPENWVVNHLVDIGTTKQTLISSQQGTAYIATENEVYEISSSGIAPLLRQAVRNDYDAYISPPAYIAYSPNLAYVIVVKDNSVTTDPTTSESETNLGDISMMIYNKMQKSWGLLGHNQRAFRGVATDNKYFYFISAQHLMKWNPIESETYWEGATIESARFSGEKGFKLAVVGIRQGGNCPPGTLRIIADGVPTDIILSATTGSKYIRLYRPIVGKRISAWFKTLRTTEFEMDELLLDIEELGVI